MASNNTNIVPITYTNASAVAKYVPVPADEWSISHIMRVHVAAGDTVTVEQTFDGLDFEPALTFTASTNTLLDARPTGFRLTCTVGFSGNSYLTVA